MQIRAKIYSPEALKPEVKEAIFDGMDMVLTYMGQIAVAKTEVVTSSLRSPEGVIDPSRISYKRLDRLVELHLVAVPFRHQQRQVGDVIEIFAGHAMVGSGCSAIDTLGSAAQIRTSTSHEVAHSLGYVQPDRMDPKNPYHCGDSDCIMHYAGRLTSQRPINGSGMQYEENSFLSAYKDAAINQHDFCLPCKMDMRETGEKHIIDLRHNRIFNRQR
jgi:hypothetical protein